MIVSTRRLDRVEATASGLSGVCLVHCLGLPLVSLLLPGLAIDSSPLVHAILLTLTVPLALIALLTGWRRHQVRWPLILGVCGLVALTWAAVSPEGAAERLLVLSGGLALLTAHLANWRLRHG